MSERPSLLDRVLSWRRADAEADEMIGRIWRTAQVVAERHRVRAALTIAHYDGPNHTPAYALALRGHADLTESGLGPPCAVLTWDQQVISAEVDKFCVGVILWDYMGHNKTVWIYLGYVSPDHRGCGIYRAMWGALVEKARDKGAVLIRGETDMRNGAMRRTAERLGRREQTVDLFFDVPPKDETRPI